MSSERASGGRAKYALAFTLPLAVLVGFASLAGLLQPEHYQHETDDWMTQSTAQDAIDLFLIVPVLTIAGLFVHRGERLAEPIWGGSLLYLVYTFVIYCFAVHFNSLFLIYVGSLGLSVWGLVYFLRIQQRGQTIKDIVHHRVSRITGIYFIILAGAFTLLWLSEVVPAVGAGKPPASLVAAGLATNPVQVLDLSIILPGIIVTGVLLLKNHPIGYLFAPILMVFFVLMDITIAAIFMAQRAKDAVQNPAGILIMSALALVSLILLLWFLRNGKS